MLKLNKKIIRIGNAGGFWGDDLSALRRQIEGGKLDYITSDYLAEITMGILMKQKIKDSSMGYVYDFLSQIEEILGLVIEKSVKIITNAGGINPQALAEKIVKIAKNKNIKTRVAAVFGDDIMDRMDELYPEKESMKNMETGEDFSKIKDSLLSSNVYLGVQPVLKALKEDSNIIVTGRVTDTAITLAPMIHEFGWETDDWDKLAAGVVGGHIIECGTQSTGGNFTDWKTVGTWNNIGFPILEVNKDGSFIVTKHQETGGLVSVDTVKEQLLYEMGDPKMYISPDVVVDFTSVRLKDVGENRVEVSGIKGAPPTKFFKVSSSFANGYKASGSILIGGTELKKKAGLFEEIFWDKTGFEFEKKRTDLIGCIDDKNDFATAMLRFAVYDHKREKIVKFGTEISTLILSGPAGAAVTGGRPKPQMVLGYWPSLIKKNLIESTVIIYSGSVVEDIFKVGSVSGLEIDYPSKNFKKSVDSEMFKSRSLDEKILLGKICLARSGDKGDTSNIGVIAKNRQIYEILKRFLTPQAVKEMFSDVCKGEVFRFEVDNLNSFNFLLEKSLGGGGAESIEVDPQGKLYAQRLLSRYLSIDKDSLKKIETLLEIE